MSKKFKIIVDIIENKKKIFVHVSKRDNVVVTEEEVRNKLHSIDQDVGILLSKTPSCYIFQLEHSHDIVKGEKEVQNKKIKKPTTRRSTRRTSKKVDNT